MYLIAGPFHDFLNKQKSPSQTLNSNRNVVYMLSTNLFCFLLGEEVIAEVVEELLDEFFANEVAGVMIHVVRG